ncbi:MAG: hypothetical protein JW839_20725, partial [Candidatus Lokiarchaeota archaeon]|nr:hypothetical protein [Candidatus Lokiarchaeota archaeon]
MKKIDPITLKVIVCLTFVVVIGLVALGHARAPILSMPSPGRPAPSDSAPLLSGHHVSPETGFTNTTFVYEVTYTDPDNDAPTYMYVYIDGPEFPMSKQNPTDNTYTDGCVYTYNTTLDPQPHTYSFSTSDGSGFCSTPFIAGPTVINWAPSLTSGSVTPSNGNASTTFTYAVTYSDAENEAPMFLYVYVDDIGFNMSKLNPSDNTYTDGCVYIFNQTLQTGSHIYYFSASDGYTATATSPASGPAVSPFLTSGSVSPSNGNASTLYEYTVIYTHMSEVAPAHVQVAIDGLSYTMVKGNSSDTTYADGCTYTFNITLSPTAHNYRFFTSDGSASFSTPTYSGPTVANTAPSLTAGSVTPTSGNLSTVFTYAVTYSDPDNNAPSYVRVVIDSYSYTMSKQNQTDTTYADGCTYVYNRTLAAGSHNYRFQASDGYSSRSTTTTSGPLVTSVPPTLTSGSVAPAAGSCTTPFVFTVNYTDADNTVPSYMRVHIDGSIYAMSKQNATDSDYTDGCIYTYSKILSVGSHSFYFSTSDGYASLTTPAVSGPTVVNEVPVLASCSVTPANGSQVTTFTFLATYNDADNHPPSNVCVVINGTCHQMMKQNAGDNTYADGCVYYYATTLAVGSHSFYFNASDGYDVVSTSASTIAVTNATVPWLANPGVTPSVGINSTVFNFTVTYFDQANAYPTSITVTINTTTYALVQLLPGDTNVVDGKVYTYSTTLPWGRYQFKMNCSNGSFQNSTSWMPGPEVDPFGVMAAVNETVFEDDFEGGTSKWPTISGLWHLTSSSSSWPNPCHSPTHSMWYGQESSGTYATGSRTYGAIMSTSFSLAGYASARLEFYQWLQGEGGSWDYCYVNVSTDGGTSWGPLYKSNANIASWQRCSLDMSGYCGYPDVRIRFYFDSIDSINNNYRGWLVDDVRITALTGNWTHTLALPSNGTMMPVGNVNFSWTNAAPIPLTFRWQLSASSNFSSVLDEAWGIPGASPGTSFVRNVSRATGCYYWRIRPESHGFWGNWSAPGQFSLRQLPVLSNGSVDPAVGNTLTTFLYSVSYFHPDNVGPSYVRVFIDGSSYTMSKQNGGDYTYTDGCVYACSPTSLSPGSHNYFFTASDGLAAVNTTTFSGP